MSRSRPRILVSTWLREVDGLVGRRRTYTLDAGYVEALTRAGTAPLLVPHLVPEAAVTLLAESDGLLLSGGPDIDPRAYGAADLGACWGVDPNADRTELALASAALDLGVPVLAICRGLQIVNVAAGGTLHQDISGLAGHPPLDGPPERLHAARHVVRLEADSALAGVYGTRERIVNTIHHQAVDRVGRGLRVVARDENGLVEALESTDGAAVTAVQWHPEKHHGEDALFARFAELARRSRAARRGLPLAA